MFDLIVILIPVFPLLAVLANGLNVLLGHRYSHDVAHRIGWGSVLLSFLCALWVFGQALGHPEPRTVIAYRWFFGGDLAVNLAFLIDPLTCIMMLVITGVGLLIHVYSVGYMHGEEGFIRFFAYMNLFMVSMLLLVMGNNYAVLFIGWEGVGLCSYLLIGYYYDRVSAAKAATKAFVVNRIGDAGFLIAIFLVFARFGTLDYTEVFAKADTLDSTTAFAIAVCLLIGAVGKSAQLPLYTWLPDAMEGPTPVSALIHAATMVTAGVYMVVRNHAIYDLTPDALLLVGVIGGATALFAATIGLVQTDIKRVLAYSTVSQLGFMFLACGVGAYAVAAFCTVFYMSRLLYVTFYGQSRVHHETAHHLHEPSWWMLGPLLFLAALSALGGLIGVFPGGLENGAFHRFLGPVVSTAAAETGGHRGGHLLPYVLMAVTTVIGLAGWFTAHYFYYVKPEQPELLANRLKGAYALLWNKYWVDELYDRLAVEPSKGAGRLLDRMDAVVVDRAVIAVEQVTDLNAAGSTWFEKYVIYGLINVMGYANHIGARILRQLQTGLVHHYAAILVTGLVVLVNLIMLFLWWGGAS